MNDASLDSFSQYVRLSDELYLKLSPAAAGVLPGKVLSFNIAPLNPAGGGTRLPGHVPVTWFKLASNGRHVGI
jgi:hypothetical protein